MKHTAIYSFWVNRMVIKIFVSFVLLLIGMIQYSDIENMSSADKKAVIVFDAFILIAFVGALYWKAVYSFFVWGIPHSFAYSLAVRYSALRSVFTKLPSWTLPAFGAFVLVVIFAHWGASNEKCEVLLASEPRIWPDSSAGADNLRRMVCESRALAPDAFWHRYLPFDAYYDWFLWIVAFVFVAIGFDAVLSFLAKWGILNRLSSITGRKSIDPHFSFFVWAAAFFTLLIFTLMALILI